MNVAPVASISGDIKIYQCHVIKENVTTPNEELPHGLLLMSCFYCPNLTATTPLYLEIKKFVNIM